MQVLSSEWCPHRQWHPQWGINQSFYRIFNISPQYLKASLALRYASGQSYITGGCACWWNDLLALPHIFSPTSPHLSPPPRQLSKPQLNHISTQPNITLVGLDMKMTLHTAPRNITKSSLLRLSKKEMQADEEQRGCTSHASRELDTDIS